MVVAKIFLQCLLCILHIYSLSKLSLSEMNCMPCPQLCLHCRERGCEPQSSYLNFVPHHSVREVYIEISFQKQSDRLRILKIRPIN